MLSLHSSSCRWAWSVRYYHQFRLGFSCFEPPPLVLSNYSAVQHNESQPRTSFPRLGQNRPFIHTTGMSQDYDLSTACPFLSDMQRHTEFESRLALCQGQLAWVGWFHFRTPLRSTLTRVHDYSSHIYIYFDSIRKGSYVCALEHEDECLDSVLPCLTLIRQTHSPNQEFGATSRFSRTPCCDGPASCIKRRNWGTQVRTQFECSAWYQVTLPR
ncbi:hypothetical protein C8Q78DRAFT_799879 [Trametes maxima]|nr:hypothetical protein C8Q78DRAFT_799879 [Trametes maxima]